MTRLGSVSVWQFYFVRIQFKPYAIACKGHPQDKPHRSNRSNLLDARRRLSACKTTFYGGKSGQCASISSIEVTGHWDIVVQARPVLIALASPAGSGITLSFNDVRMCSFSLGFQALFDRVCLSACSPKLVHDSGVAASLQEQIVVFRIKGVIYGWIFRS